MDKIREALGTLREILQESPQDKLVDIIKKSVEKAEKQPEKYEAVVKSQDTTDISDNLYLLSKMLNASPTDLKYYHTVYKSTITKGLTTATTGGGAEWIPEELSPKIFELVMDYAKVADKFQEIVMPTNPYTFPVYLDRLMGYYRPESYTTNPIDITNGATITDAVTLRAKTLMAYIPMTFELTEDIIAPALPLIKQSIAKSIARAIDYAIINGDTNSTPLDSDLTAASDPRKAFDGLRRYAHNASLTETVNLATNGATDIRKLRALLKGWGVEPDQLLLIASPSAYLQLLNTEEVVTVDKFGNDATLKTGKLPRIDGIPILVTDMVREDLTTSGVYSSSGAYTEIILVYPAAFIRARRGSLVVDTDQDKLLRRNDLIAAIRVDFAPLSTPSSDYPVVAIGLGIPNSL